MILVRPALPEDATELVRLRGLMFEAMPSMAGQTGPGPWQAATEVMLRECLTAPVDAATMAVFVVDDPEHPGRLASCAVGTLERRLPAPGNLDGRYGFVFNICTAPAHRGRGYARACTESLLTWFDDHQVGRIDLHATEGGESLYRSLGFSEYSIALSRT